MIKVYFDWGVLSQMKNGYQNELAELVSDNDKLFIPYSTSHIGDILSSLKEDTHDENEFIKSDLDYISKITEDKCLMNTGKDVVLDFYPPEELFNERVESKNLFSDFSMEGLMAMLGQDELYKNIAGDVFKSLEESFEGDAFKQAFENPETAEQMNKMFPGLKENPTLDGFFKSFSQMNNNLNELDGYKDLRKIFQEGMGNNRDRINNSNDPYKIIEAESNRLGIDLNEYVNHSTHAPEWFQEITNEYLLLDMHGYKEDRVRIHKGRKETFKNTTEDAFHAAFASTCNFYVVDDNKSYNKAVKVYEKLGINTKVFKTADFVKHYNDYLNIQSPPLNFHIPFKIIETSNYYEEAMDNGTLRTYDVPFFFFSFFNRVRMFIPDDGTEPFVVLCQHKPTNYTNYLMEVQRLYKELNQALGDDLENIGNVKEEEFTDKWNGRKWKLNDITLRLVRPNGYFQLYFDT